MGTIISPPIHQIPLAAFMLMDRRMERPLPPAPVVRRIGPLRRIVPVACVAATRRK